ncbi:uncharacterized protein J4E88_006320 [Alternaria novae-zelandiae]|uniref:uncharacterized protein n=2 Tax=Alternaria TaxID=5598 RepID=UPI0020C2754A|nr:uncharacterized protein J4E93_007407 [Alternaria ventricosa]XP_049210387.1 uncharacterized protein J4E79_006118 [Alternaria viburni]XP_049223529.1 uncharacterized protein J4E78_003816 [Alternaria triticimaculans]XP_049233393.1 uncharacterized protein J4E87_005557 [Alternaria ethzedia]XP_049254258.1 uncharacterized protein J4E88_006320 [Alternaria novae-zelandiae]XP_051300463.1 uncharacterized protein J4E86_007679 [Alternaria arbusti]XP_051326424.1 uncharacterized protein J4E85_005345 [Alte
MPAAPSQFPSSCSSAPAPHNPKSSAPYFLHPRRTRQQSPAYRHETATATPAPPTATAFERLVATRSPQNAARRITRSSARASGFRTVDASMEPRRRPEYNLEIFADAACVKDVVKAILHTIFFHRYFTSISPLTRDLLDLTLPAIDDVDLETLIEQKTFALVRAIDSTHQPRGRGQIVVQFFEKKRKKTSYFFSKADEDVCWEQWTLDVTLAQPRTETDVLKVRRAMTKSLEKAAHKIIAIVNREKDHIPPITTTDANPFPYQIVVNPKSVNENDWRPRIGLF